MYEMQRLEVSGAALAVKGLIELCLTVYGLRL